MGKGRMGNLTEQEYMMKSLSDWTYNYFLNRMLNLSVAQIGWKNLPETIDERYLEWVLCTNGIGVAFNYNPRIDGGKDFENQGLVFMKSALGGDFDIYNLPKIRNAYAVQGVNVTLNENNSVICFNNITRTSELPELMMFANRLTNAARIRDMNIDVQRMSGVFVCEEKERLSMANFFKNFWNYMPFTISRRAKSQERYPIEAVRPDIPIVFDKLTDVYHDIWNEFLTWRGINNSNVDKRERVNTEEVKANSEEIQSARDCRLLARQQFADKFNKMFGQNIKPYWRSAKSLRNDDLLIFGEDGEELENENLPKENLPKENTSDSDSKKVGE